MLMIDYLSKWKMNVVRNKLLVSFIDPTPEHVLMLIYFSSTLFDIMKIINSEGKSSLILGNFNIYYLKSRTNDKTRYCIDGILS